MKKRFFRFIVILLAIIAIGILPSVSPLQISPALSPVTVHAEEDESTDFDDLLAAGCELTENGEALSLEEDTVDPKSPYEDDSDIKPLEAIDMPETAEPEDAAGEYTEEYVDETESDSPSTGDAFEDLEVLLSGLEEGKDYDGFLFAMKEPVSEETQAALDYALSVGSVTKKPFTSNLYTSDYLSNITNIADGGQFAYVEPDYLGGVPEQSPNDTYYSNTSYNYIQKDYMSLMNVPSFWDWGYEGQDCDRDIDLNGDGNEVDDPVVVAVIDSGMYYTESGGSRYGHEDFGTFYYGINFINSAYDTNTQDIDGHGTMVSSIIAAIRNNGRGMAGLMNQVRILPLRVFDPAVNGGDARSGDVIDAINAAIEYRNNYLSNKSNGLNIGVINMSLGFNGESTALKEACEKAKKAGIIVISAAGNSGSKDMETEAQYPAQYTIGVGAVDPSGTRASFSQVLSSDNGEGFENKVWVTAAGEKIICCGDKLGYYDKDDIYHVRSDYSSLYNSYCAAGGTSQAAPMVSALAAACKTIRNDLTHDEFKTILRDTSSYKYGNRGSINGQDIEYGWGIVNFERAIDSVSDCSIRFSANGGSGTMDTLFLPRGSYYTLPPCAFTAPKCKVFNGWNEGSAGTQLQITRDLTIKPNWKAAHKLKKTAAKAATCKATGNTEYYTCTVCGKYFSDSKGTKEIKKDSWVTKKTAHKLTLTKAKAATCVSTGNTAYYTCSVCGKYFSDSKGTKEIKKNSWVTKKAAHKLTKTNAKAATCTSKGNTAYYTCTVCWHYFSDSAGTKEIAANSWVTKATGHSWDAGKVTKQPTTSAEGVKTYTCTKCGTTKTESIPRKTSSGEFPDATHANVNDTSYNAIYWAVANGIVKGYDDGTFRPEGICTREQFSIMLWRFAGAPNANANSIYRFNDSGNFSSGAKKAVAWAVEQGIVQGFNDGSFRPKDNITRAQVAVMLWRFAGQPGVYRASKFLDIGSFSSNVQKAIIWLEANKIASGYNDGTFRPNDGCQRQHMAIFLYRYAKNIWGW